MAQIRIGTRKSPLARWQAEWVAQQLFEQGHQVELVWIVTQGDVTTQPLGQVGGQGLFTKEIQRALLESEVDLAVHSLKDLPTDMHPELKLAAVPHREKVEDCLIGRTAPTVAELPQGAIIGTGSLRRAAQLRAWRSDLVVNDIRGNVDTRLRKLDEGNYDAILLAGAGLGRLGLDHRITERLPLDRMLPAVGQGALGLEIRQNDATTFDALQSINDPASFAAVTAERSLLNALRAGCLAPVAAWGRIEEGQLHLTGRVLALDGSRILEQKSIGPPEEALDIGKAMAELLIQAGAHDLIQEARKKPEA